MPYFRRAAVRIGAEKIAAVYARVSTARQAEEELPLASQIEQCTARAESLGARVDRVFIDEGRSGRCDDRPAFQEAIQYCETATPDYLVTWSTSRFARNKVDAGLYKLRLARAGVEIVYVSLQIDRNTDGGWMTESVLELFDEFYSRQISADTVRSMLKNAHEGYFNGGRVPFGYEIDAAPDNPKRKKLRPHMIEAEVVREIFALRVHGLGAKTIAIGLQDRGIRNRNTAWTKSSVAALLRNDTVIGCTVFGRRDRATRRLKPRDQWVIVQSHEPIIDIDTWNAVQNMMDDATIDSTGSPKSTFLFTGILHCAETGSSMQIESAKGRSRRYHYYNCRDAQKKGIGENRRIAAREFDQWMVGVILDQILTKDFLTEVLEDLNEACGTWAKDHAKRRKAAAAGLAAASAKNERIYELFEKYGRDTPNLADVTTRLRANNKMVKEWEKKLAAIDAERPPEFHVNHDDVAELAEALRYIIETTDNPKKLRHFFSTFIDKIWVEDTSVRIEYRPECLVRQPEPRAVPSRVMWLPEHDLLGTRLLSVELPERFHRKAA